jgi:hypothetical protein
LLTEEEYSLRRGTRIKNKFKNISEPPLCTDAPAAQTCVSEGAKKFAEGDAKGAVDVEQGWHVRGDFERV